MNLNDRCAKLKDLLSLSSDRSAFGHAIGLLERKLRYEQANPDGTPFASWEAKRLGSARNLAGRIAKATAMTKLASDVARRVPGTWLADDLNVLVRLSRISDPKDQTSVFDRLLEGSGKGLKELREHERKLGVEVRARDQQNRVVEPLAKTDSGHEAHVVFRGRELVVSVSPTLDSVELCDRGSVKRASPEASKPTLERQDGPVIDGPDPVDRADEALSEAEAALDEASDDEEATNPFAGSPTGAPTPNNASKRTALLDGLAALGFGSESVADFHRMLLGGECTSTERDVYVALSERGRGSVLDGRESFRAAAVAALWATKGIRPAYLVVPEQELTSAYFQLEDFGAAVMRARRRKPREIDAARAALRQVRLTASAESEPNHRWVATGFTPDALPAWASRVLGSVQIPKALGAATARSRRAGSASVQAS